MFFMPVVARMMLSKFDKPALAAAGSVATEERGGLKVTNLRIRSERDNGINGLGSHRESRFERSALTMLCKMSKPCGRKPQRAGI